MDVKLKFKEIYFSAAHYIPGHSRCGSIHGHTYAIKGLEIDCYGDTNDQGMFIDFSKIKQYFKENWDHKFIVPKVDEKYWTEILDSDKRKGLKVMPTEYHTTVEHIAFLIFNELVELLAEEWGLDPEGKDSWLYSSIRFSLYEGPNQGVSV